MLGEGPAALIIAQAPVNSRQNRGTRTQVLPPPLAQRRILTIGVKRTQYVLHLSQFKKHACDRWTDRIDSEDRAFIAAAHGKSTLHYDNLNVHNNYD